MRGFISTLAMTGLMAIGLAGCYAEVPADSGDGEVVVEEVDEEVVECANCAKGAAGEDVFCAECSKGYVGGEEVTACVTCFAEKTGGPPCPT